MKYTKSAWIMTASLSTMCAPVFAQSSVTLYGVIDQGINYVNNAQALDASGKRVGRSQWSESSSILAGNRFGLRGSEDLGGQYKAIFQIESGFDLGTGKFQQGGSIFGRQAFVGLSGPVGTITLGRQYDFMVDFVQPESQGAIGGGGTFGLHGVDIDNVGNTYRMNNAVKFKSASYNGLVFGGMYSFGGAAGSLSTNSGFSLGASYNQGPLKVAAAFVNIREPNLSYWGNNQLSSTTANNLGATAGVQTNSIYGGFASARSLEITGAGVIYALSDALSVGANYSNIRFEHLGDPNAGTLALTNPFGYQGTAIFNSYSVFGRYKFTPSVFVTGAYNYLTGGGVDGKPPAKYNMFYATAHYLLSKRTDTYIAATYQTASGVDSTNQSAVPTTLTVTPSNSSRQVIVRVGILHSF